MLVRYEGVEKKRRGLWEEMDVQVKCETFSASFSKYFYHSTEFSFRNDSLHQWVKELRILCEAECMNTLQSKSLPGDTAPPPPTVRHAVRAIQRRAHEVSTEFARLCQ